MKNLRKLKSEKTQPMRLIKLWPAKKAFALSVTSLVLMALACLFPLPKPTGGGALAESGAQDPSISISASGLLNLTLAAGGLPNTASATITTATTNYTGYKLYFSAKDENTSMVIVGGTPNNPNDTIESIESSIDPYTSGNGFENRWGYKVDSAEDTYDPIPKSSARAQIGDYTTASSGNNTTLTIAAKAGATKAQGTYIGNLTVTAIANINKVYSLTYNKNTEDIVTNLPNNIPQTSTTNNTPSIQIPSNIPTREGYDFVSWCTTQVLDGETCSGTAYDPGEQMTIDLDPTTANVIMLYAVWESNLADFNKAFANAGKSKVSGTSYYAMQDMTPEICDAVDLLIEGILVDTRDNNKTYSVAKLDDGNCWMTQNLALGSDSLGEITLTSADSDVTSDFTLSTPTTTSFSSSAYNVVNYRNYTSKSSNYYNWYTATAGTGTQTTSAYTAASSSICPKGWRLPNGSSASGVAGEWAELFYAAGITSTLATSTSSVSYATGGAAKRAAAPYNIPNSYGYFDATGSSPTDTFYTYFWTNRTYSSTSYAWSTYIGSSSPTLNYGSRYKYQGMPMRCVAHKAETQPTITYNANGGTGSIASQTAASASEFPQSFTLSDGTGMTRTNYVLVGWSTDPNATTTTMEYKLGQTIETVSNLNLYAVWLDLSSLTTFDSAFASDGKSKDTTTNLYKMQDMNSTICGNVTNTETTIYAVSTQLVDTRDNKIYWVSKLKDGNCWMTQNLDLDLDPETTLTPDDTNITSNWTPPATAKTVVKTALTSSNWATASDYTHPYSFDGGNAYLPNGLLSSSCSNKNITACSGAGTLDLTDATAVKDNVNAHYHVGNLYTWTAAIAMNDSSSYSSDTSSNYNNSPQTSICPKGWRLPNGASNGHFKALNDAYGGNTSNDNTLRAEPLFFARSGHVSFGSLNGVSSNGIYWSSTVYSSYDAYNLNFYSTRVNPTNNSGRYLGYAVRCVAQ